MSTIGSNIAALKSLHNLRLNEDGFAKAQLSCLYIGDNLPLERQGLEQEALTRSEFA